MKNFEIFFQNLSEKHHKKDFFVLIKRTFSHLSEKEVTYENH